MQANEPKSHYVLAKKQQSALPWSVWRASLSHRNIITKHLARICKPQRNVNHCWKFMFFANSFCFLFYTQRNPPPQIAFINRGNSRIVPRSAGICHQKAGNQILTNTQTFSSHLLLCLPDKAVRRWASSGHLFSAPWWLNRLITHRIIHHFNGLDIFTMTWIYVGLITFSKDEFAVRGRLWCHQSSNVASMWLENNNKKLYWNLIFPINLHWQVSWSCVICGYYNW